MKLAVALSCFNLVPDIALNLDIIRKMWLSHNDAYVVVCCNHPESLERIRTLDADEVVPGADLPYSNKPELRRRQVDCWQRSNRAALDHADYVVHYHADAHALQVEPILQIIDEMERRDCWVAGRGRGMDFRNSKAAYGDVDDHFFISRTDEAKRHKLWHIDPGRMLRQINSESFLSYSIQKSEGQQRFYLYSNMAANLVDASSVPDDAFYPDGVCHRHMHPFNYDPERGFLHTNDWDVKRKFMQKAFGDRFSTIEH
ncbi:hypothetical protein M1O55_03330, partial [Dehalococcoidia bacterium]|nr:hypothetical protein [Dehalococcoidia bacterium]